MLLVTIQPGYPVSPTADDPCEASGATEWPEKEVCCGVIAKFDNSRAELFDGETTQMQIGANDGRIVRQIGLGELDLIVQRNRPLVYLS